MPSRRSDASIASMRCLRDSPRSFGPFPIGQNAFVAMTTWSRGATP